MRKTQSKLAERTSQPAAAVGRDENQDKKRQRRESIESFVVVFLAFLIWSFEAEGFVIPTGSMAPTLMGRHKEIVCPECGYTYTVNADCEVDSSGSGAPARACGSRGARARIAGSRPASMMRRASRATASTR